MIKWEHPIHNHQMVLFSVDKISIISTGLYVFLLLFSAGCSSSSVEAANSELVSTVTILSDTITPSTIPTETPIPSTATPEITSTVEATQVPVTATVDSITSASDATVVPTDEDGLPLIHYVYGIAGHKQYFKLGCEAAATRDWALFFGYDINEFEFQTRLPLSDNPEVGFVGSVDSKWGQAPPYAYGVHAAPVAQLLHEYDVPAIAVKDFSLKELKQQIAADHPVVVWVIGNMVGGVPYEYTAKDGQKVIVAAYEHVVIVTGYNETHIRYLNNDKYFETPTDVFLNSWKVLGNMALIAGN